MVLKKWTIISLLITMLMMGTAGAVWAEDAGKNDLKVILGADGYGTLKLPLSNSFDVDLKYHEDALKTGVYYHLSDKIGIKAGARYDLDAEKTNAYGGIDFSIPFGDNLRIAGFYDSGFEGEKWDRYEAAVRIQMYEHHFLYAGVRGEEGKDATVYEYNEDKQPMLFLRGDFTWQWKQWEVALRPMLHIQGDFFHDYDLKYNVNKDTKLVFNVNSQYEQVAKYRLGFERKF